MAIAMKDLEIRGAGNLLGGEQSGHIADVGFDLYVRLVGEAVNDFKGEAEHELTEVRIELTVEAHQIGRVSCRGRECQEVLYCEVEESLHKHTNKVLTKLLSLIHHT